MQPLTTEKWSLRHTESFMFSLDPQKDLHFDFITLFTLRKRSLLGLDFLRAKNSCCIYQSPYQVFFFCKYVDTEFNHIDFYNYLLWQFGFLHPLNSNKICIFLNKSGKSPGPLESSKHDFIRLSFKDGYDSTFTTKLSTVVLNRRWETVPISTSLPGAPPPVQVSN